MNAQNCEQLTLFPEASHANPFPWLESKKVKGTTVTSGRRCLELSENLARVGLSVRMYLESSELPGKQFVRTWSVRDMLSPYLILKLRLSERPTGESECSLWPAATACEWKGRGPNSKQQGLAEAAKMWPTPVAGDSQGSTGGGMRSSLRTSVKLFPTPSANEDAAGTPNGKMQKMLGNHPDVRSTGPGTLNPDWVEWLMGFPPGWTVIGE